MNATVNASNQSRHFAALDGLRGLAAILVAAYHLDIHAYQHGYMAVDFFFILSGFVIAFSYEGKLIAGKMNFFDFMKRRLIRLYPLIIAGTLLGFSGYYIISFFQPEKAVSTTEVLRLAAMGLLLIPTTSIVHVGEDDNLFPFDGPLWSLYFEVVFNVLYALTVRFLNMRALLGVIVISICLLVIPILEHHTIGFGYSATDFIYGFPRTAAAMSLGVVILRLYQIRKLPKFSCHFACLGAALLLLLAMPKSTGWSEILYDPVCVFLLFPAIIVAGININPEGRILKICQISGNLSYPLYALHRPLEHMGTRILRNLTPDYQNWYFNMLVLAGCIIISYLLFKLYDEPVRKILSFEMRRLRGRAAK